MFGCATSWGASRDTLKVLVSCVDVRDLVCEPTEHRSAMEGQAVEHVFAEHCSCVLQLSSSQACEFLLYDVEFEAEKQQNGVNCQIISMADDSICVSCLFSPSVCLSRKEVDI